MNIAIFADLHLPDRDDTVKETVWRWALNEARRRNADLIVGLGDMTAVGTVAAARRIVRDLDACGIPYLLTPGNAEYRTPAETGETLATLRTETEKFPVLLLDSAKGPLAEADSVKLRTLTGKDRLVFSHCPPESWSEADRAALVRLIAEGVIARAVFGHRHFDAADGAVSLIRGLDPDKAMGGPPALVMLSGEADGWTQRDVPCPLADPTSWSLPERKAFFRNFGLCGMKTPEEYLNFAADHRIANFELRWRPDVDFAAPELRAVLNRWRQAGGRILSMHLADIKLENGEFAGLSDADASVASALACGCDRATVHVPRCFQDELPPSETERVAREFHRRLLPLLERGIAVGVENLHTSEAERADKRYKFGCTMTECRRFIAALKEAAGRRRGRIGLHLDIGHARNNKPFEQREMLSSWYAGMRDLTAAMHVHQVSRDGDKLKNHTGFAGWFEPMISLAGLAMAWRAGQIGDVPMFLELRTPAPETWLALRDGLSLNDESTTLKR